MKLFICSILVYFIVEKESASITELVHQTFLLFCLDCDLWPTSLIHILIFEDLALLNCQSKKSLLKLLFTLKSVLRLIFKCFVKLSANIKLTAKLSAVPSLVRWRPSFQTIFLPILSLHMKLKLLVAHKTFSMLLTFKVSEYPFKQNRSMLKNATVLLYTYFFNISLNVLRPTFFNICNFSFLHSLNIGKIRAKVGPKTNYSSYFMSSCTNIIAVFNNLFHWYVVNQETNKTMPTFFFFLNIF